MSAPRIYPAITAITADLARRGIAKGRVNEAEGYAYRSIDDICQALAPLLAQHRLCILPRVLERLYEAQTALDGSLLTRAMLHVAFDLVSARDGSVHCIEAYGEALDASDKATAKAMSSAYKQAVLQAFCIPIRGADDPDAMDSNVIAGTDTLSDPVQGWQQWAADIGDVIASCQTTEALGRVQATYHGLLRAASKREPAIYANIGAAIKDRRRELAASGGTSSTPPASTSGRAKPLLETANA